jgi:mRNA-degrading endonuclease RelE of RelBE toxin-antitoxin system
MFDDTVAGAFRVTYVVDSEHERVFVVRIRKALRSG